MSKKLTVAAKKKRGKSFPIVAIGASAGGLEAVSDLLKNLPADTGMAYIYIQHLHPTHESKLPVILARATKMKVVQARQHLSIEPDHLYIIPPNKDMHIVDGILALNERAPKPALHMPIDKFLISLAEKQKEGAIGIILSGNANDGTLGLKALKSSGGLTFAQDDSAKFQSMPKSAITEGVVDLVLSPAGIAHELAEIGKQTDVIQKALGDLSENDLADEELGSIIQLLKKNVGVDFSHYKMNTIKRRIIRRMLLHKLSTLSEYFQYLRKHTGEINTLYQDLLINVTSFFRDPDTIEYLKKTLLPKIVKGKAQGEPVRIWIPACSTGEEAYSLAIVITEILGDKAANVPVQIFATDLSEMAIAKARLGMYSRNDVLDISPKRLQRFFTKIDGSYRILKSIRELCVFAPHNIFKDPPFSRLDLISCCNLMIYLDSVLQKKVIATFHYALRNNGYLVLGKSETISTSAQLFLQVEKKYKVYSRKKETSSPAVLEMNYRVPGIDRTELVSLRKNNRKENGQEADLEKTVDILLLNHYMPACVVVNQELEILLFRGSTGLFLEPAPGKASLNLVKMARPGLAFELKNAVHKAGKSGERIKKTGLEIKSKDITYQIAVEVVPLPSDGEERLFLVLFEKVESQPVMEIRPTLKKDKVVKKLEEELRTIKDDMRSIIEEHEASNEELQSANEEIVSSNEELQSINEELETSKEEVESTNEELLTINAELQIRNEQLAESYEYAEAVFETIREAVLVLDKDLRVKSANRSFYKIFQTREEETEGVYVYELGNRQWNVPQLRDFLEDVIPRNTQFNGYEVTHIFPDIGEKIMLLNGRKVVQRTHNQQLILLAIEDITEHRQAQKILADREAWFRNMADNLPVMVWVANPFKIYTFMNRTGLEYLGRKLEVNKGNDWTDAVHREDMESYLRVFHSSFKEHKPFSVEYRLRRNDGEYRWILDIGRPTFSHDGTFTGYTGSCTEIHDKRIMHDELEKLVNQRTVALTEANKHLLNSNAELEQYAYVASHDLQEPLRKIMTFVDRLQKHKDDLPDNARIFIDKITASSQRMTQLIDDLLNFSKASSSAEKLAATDLTKSLKNVLIDFDMIISQKNAVINVGNLPVIPAIRIQIEQLFHNLISNSLKFAREDVAPVITVSARDVPPEEAAQHPLLDASCTYVEITFSDNGIGFNPEYAEHVFTIFQRIADKHKFPGTGIGLALCRKIVNNHGGIIFAVSEENNGSAFHVILPVK